MFDSIRNAMQVLAQVGQPAAEGAAGRASQPTPVPPQTPDAASGQVEGGVSGTPDVSGAGVVPAPADPSVPPVLGDAGDSLQAGADAAAQLAGAAMNSPLPEVASDTGMFYFIQQSDWVGQSLFFILVLMSLASWYLIIFKCISNIRTHRRSDRFLNEFWSAGSLEQVEHEIATHGASEPFAHVTSHAIHARNHHAKYGALKLEEKGSTSAFVTRTIRKVIDEETAKLENGLTVLASVGSTAPFVGLFGTVWGVYHALIGIGLSDGVTVNRIAGPVGEALIMTGLGLAVAIPAVLAYNAFVRSNRVYLARLDAFAHDLFTFLSTGQQQANGYGNKRKRTPVPAATTGE